jgi:ATP-dependent Lhr-like helicase
VGGAVSRGDRPSEPEHELLRETLARSPRFFTDFLAELDLPPEVIQEALWDLVWAGEVTNDAFAPLRAPRLTLAKGPAQERRTSMTRRRFGTRRGAGASAPVQGRWSLTEALFAASPAGGAPDPGLRRRAWAELLLERYGVVTREQVLAEGIPGGFSILYESLGSLETIGVCRRGYFVEGLGGAQFALPGAVERLRAQRDAAEQPPIVLASTDPAQPYGAALPWPRRADGERRPARVRGAYVVLAGAEPVLYVEKGGKGVQRLVEPDDARIRTAFEALADHVKAGRIKRLDLEKVDGQPVVGSPLEDLLVDLGFRLGPRKLTLIA